MSKPCYTIFSFTFVASEARSLLYFIRQSGIHTLVRYYFIHHPICRMQLSPRRLTSKVSLTHGISVDYASLFWLVVLLSSSTSRRTSPTDHRAAHNRVRPPALAVVCGRPPRSTRSSRSSSSTNRVQTPSSF